MREWTEQLSDWIEGKNAGSADLSLVDFSDELEQGVCEADSFLKVSESFVSVCSQVLENAQAVGQRDHGSS